MTAQDVCVLFQQTEPTGSFLSHGWRSRVIIAQLDAAGLITSLYEGPWYATGPNVLGLNSDEDKKVWILTTNVISGLIADGWVRLGAAPTFSTEAQQFYRVTRSAADKVRPLADRMKYVNEITQAGQYPALAMGLQAALEAVRDRILESDGPASHDFVSLLERLARLHQEGHLTDAEFEQAKRKAGLTP